MDSQKMAKKKLRKERHRSPKRYKPKKTQKKLNLPSSTTATKSLENKFKKLVAPRNLTLRYEHVLEVLKFIAKIKKYGHRGHYLDLDLRDVRVIAEGALAMLLSVIDDLSRHGILCKGDKPTNIAAKDILEASGFMDRMGGTIASKNQNSKNKILTTGTKDTHHQIIVPEVYKAMETVWGTKARCPCLYGGIGEMLRNSCDHAFSTEDKITWHLGISHNEEENSVKFSFVDNGKGITETYSRNFIYRAARRLFGNNAALLKAAFEDGIESQTGLSWRGKGLPTIFEMYTDNIITSLVVITNNVYLDFDGGIIETIKVNFEGTYYFWKINKTCEQNAHFPI